MADPRALLRRALSALGELLDPPSFPVEISPRPDGRGGTALVRDGYTLKDFAAPVRGARQHAFLDWRDAADWIARHADPSRAEILLSFPDPRETGLSEMESPGLAIWLDPARDPMAGSLSGQLAWSTRFAAWLSAFARPLSQREMLLLVRDAASDFGEDIGLAVRAGGLVVESDEGPGPLSSVAQLVSAISTLQVTRSDSLEQTIDPHLAYIAFRGNDGKQDVRGHIPTELRIAVPVFDGLVSTRPIDEIPEPGMEGDVAAMKVRVELVLGHDEPRFRLSCPELRDVIRNATMLLRDRMEELLRSLRPRAAPFKIHLGAARVESIAGALRNGDELVPPALESARPGRSAPEEDPVVEQPSGE